MPITILGAQGGADLSRFCPVQLFPASCPSKSAHGVFAKANSGTIATQFSCIAYARNLLVRDSFSSHELSLNPSSPFHNFTANSQINKDLRGGYG